MNRKLKSFLASAVFALAALPSLAVPAPVSSAVNTVTFSQLDPSFNGGEPVRGVDISSIISLEQAGVKFYDDNGKEQDIFRTLAQHGVNYIRVRVWNDPYDSDGHSYGAGNCDVYNAGVIGKRAAEYGIKLLVDIQYSDFWADPGKQTRPKYWQSHDHNILKGEIYKWTTWVLTSVTEAGGDIGMVQVGNETNCFFLGEKDMYQICDLFASGNQAVRDFDRNILIAHHFANPAQGYYPWYAKVMAECNLDYDIFATSYYPYWHGTAHEMSATMKQIAQTYNKYVMVAETAYPYTSDDGDNFHNAVSAGAEGSVFNYDISVDGQAQCLTDVFQAMADCGKYGLGVFYWEPAWLGVPDISWSEQKQKWENYGSGWATEYAAEFDSEVTAAGGSSYDNQALFDFHGNPLPSLSVFDNILPQTKVSLSPVLTEIQEGTYRIKNAATGKYLTVSDALAENGANVVQYTADGAAEYNTWNIIKDENGYYRIYSAVGDGEFLLDLSNADTADRTNIGIYSDTGSDAQRFGFAQTAAGFNILTKSSGGKSAVEIKDGSSDDSANVQQFTLNGELCQEWILEPVEEHILAGDLNDDGVINVYDMVLLREAIADRTSPGAGDVNGDDSVNTADLVAEMRHLLGASPLTRSEKGTPRNTIFPGRK